MNICYGSRFHRLARLFSFGLLDGPQGIAVSRNGRLTISPARTNVALLYVSLDDVGTAIARVRSGS
jgi:hypothetical protein